MNRFYALLFALCILCPLAKSQSVNLTPWPAQMSTSPGTFILPHNLSIQTSGLDADEQTEVRRFADELSHTTGIRIKYSRSKRATLKVNADPTLKDAEGYRLTITKKGIVVAASSATGLFYAFQSIYKMLPPNVCAGVRDTSQTYELPLADITDRPRFAYRGFMLDVSRHFFDTAEIKKMLRLMAHYKMNHFHWHLTDDQGWRVEIKKYPKLTSIGAVRSNSWNTDLVKGSHWTGKPYGPYFYTQDDIRDVVAYADSLHITVVPEVEMPGHLAAAMAAYPEYSCAPDGEHRVWVDGGISTDVLNVANPAAVQFAKDILTELAPLFPGTLFHVGGDETPTTAWENNTACQAIYASENLQAYSQLQSRFTREIAAHLHLLGKRIAVWNEAITARGADIALIKASEAMVFCWNPCQKGALKAAEAGLKTIITNWGTDGCYYINRRANSKDFGAGRGIDDIKKMYDYQPVPATVPESLQRYYYGVQGTFWCEHVSENEHLEHLALPRLMGIAEAGWTPQERRSFTHFIERMKTDTAFLRLAGYRYHPQFIDYEGAEP